MKLQFPLLSSLIYVLLLVSPISQAKKSEETLIRWIQLDQPPAFVVKGTKHGQGFVDYVQKRLQSHLADYDHYSLLVNSGRHKAILNSNKNLCFSYLEYFPDLPTLAYPFWISYWEKEYQVPSGTMISLPVDEMKYPYILVAVGCKTMNGVKKSLLR